MWIFVWSEIICLAFIKLHQSLVSEPRMKRERKVRVRKSVMESKDLLLYLAKNWLRRNSKHLRIIGELK